MMANNAINYNIESAQFEQAQTILISLAKVVKNVMLNPYSSGYVRASFWKTTPQFERTGKNLTITILNASNNEPYEGIPPISIPQNIIKIKGGPLIGVLNPKTIYGNDTVLLDKVNASLGAVKVFQSDGAWVTLDYSRARCVYIGCLDIYNASGSTYVKYDAIEIIVVNMSLGSFPTSSTGTFQYLITVENQGVTQNSFVVSENIKVRAEIDGEAPQELDVSSQEWAQNGQVLVNVVTITIQISVFEGG